VGNHTEKLKKYWKDCISTDQSHIWIDR